MRKHNYVYKCNDITAHLVHIDVDTDFATSFVQSTMVSSFFPQPPLKSYDKTLMSSK